MMTRSFHPRRSGLAAAAARRVAAILFAPIALISLSTVALADERVGHVESARGTVNGLLGGETRTLETGEGVYLHEVLQTGAAARITVALGFSTRLKMGERTRVRIDRGILDNGGELVIDREAAIWFDRPEAGTSQGVVVKTPLAVIAARGTSFFVGPSNGVIGVFVESGAVSVTNSAGSVVLNAGEGTNLTAEDVAPTPPVEWGTPRVEAARAAVN